jgi:predicted peroxiredoxin
MTFTRKTSTSIRTVVTEQPSVDKLVIVLWSAGPEQPALAAAPFVYALAARALEIQVEMHFTSTAVQWLLPGVADAAHTDAERTKTVGDFIREVKTAGVQLYACGMAMHEHARGQSLIAECDAHAGAATVVAETLNPRTRTLIF